MSAATRERTARYRATAGRFVVGVARRTFRDAADDCGCDCVITEERGGWLCPQVRLYLKVAGTSEALARFAVWWKAHVRED